MSGSNAKDERRDDRQQDLAQTCAHDGSLVDGLKHVFADLTQDLQKVSDQVHVDLVAVFGESLEHGGHQLLWSGSQDLQNRRASASSHAALFASTPSWISSSLALGVVATTRDLVLSRSTYCLYSNTSVSSKNRSFATSRPTFCFFSISESGLMRYAGAMLLKIGTAARSDSFDVFGLRDLAMRRSRDSCLTCSSGSSMMLSAMAAISSLVLISFSCGDRSLSDSGSDSDSGSGSGSCSGSSSSCSSTGFSCFAFITRWNEPSNVLIGRASSTSCCCLNCLGRSS
ncbi:hypothetical protein OGAPHI_005505 [Ogataea philodendri]|uniref:Uncharacterized protein n=1 Tax=Ogataea philodendri TaxID=1378263 RepID=A0A9P8NZA7_9ASCO|nr:uncharacterized protein OGAPHI_005505 [Ogataea philodendri]KAH3662257.1 hypothetical protein OGAPHI_005505 [Ogataea philodendri]